MRWPAPIAWSGNSQAITRPETGNNPPYLHPEDVRAEPGRTPELYRTGAGPGNAQRTPLDKIIATADKNLFKTMAKGGGVPLASTNVPSAMNAGRGAEDSTAEPPRLPAAPEPKEAKKDEKKDGKEGKKDEPKTPGGDKK